MIHFSSSTAAGMVCEAAICPALRHSIEQCRATFEGQRVLVTGAHSFLGRHLVRALERAGAYVADEVNFLGDFSYVFDLVGAIDPSEMSGGSFSEKQPLIIHTSERDFQGENVIGLRLCQVFGPQDLDFESSIIARAMRSIFRDGESPEMSMSAMDEYHDYIFVEDAVRALLHLACFEGCRGKVYDLPGTHYGATADVLREVVAQVGHLQDEIALVAPRSALAQHHWHRSIRIVPSKLDGEAGSTPRGDGSRLWRDAEFEPETSFRDGLQLTAQFYASYFAGSVPSVPRSKTASPIHEQRAEPAFETVYTDDGLPVYVLNPHAHVRDKGAPRVEEQRPRSFVVESVLMAN